MYVQRFDQTAHEIHRNPAKAGKWDYRDVSRERGLERHASGIKSSVETDPQNYLNFSTANDISMPHLR